MGELLFGFAQSCKLSGNHCQLFRAFVEMIRDETVGIHCDRNKPEIPACASFHNTERRTCYYNDLSKPVMGRMWLGISHRGTL